MANSPRMVADVEVLGPMTVEEYFRWRALREEPWEYVAGRPVPKFPAHDNPIVATTSGTADHHTIQVTCASIIRARRAKRCRVATDAMVQVAEGRRIPAQARRVQRAGIGARDLGVEGHRRRVRTWTRTGRGWEIVDTIGSGALRSELLGADITLDEIYEDTTI